MRAYGRRKALALAAGVLAAATACSADVPPAPSKAPASAAAASPTPSEPEPAVTREEAAKVFRDITLTDDALRVKSDEHDLEGRLSLATDITTGGQTQLTVAAYLSTDYAPPRYRWGAPTLYVPRFPPEERSPWFSALATRAGDPTLLTFAKSDRWRLSSVARLLPGQESPRIELDEEGYATALASDDKTVTISPQFIGPVHATMAETGSSGVTAGLIAPGQYTSEIAEQIAQDREQAREDGFTYDSIFSADNWPVYGLRTENGGALIQYSLTRNTSTRNVANKSYIIPVPEDASWSIPTRSVPRSLKVTEIHQ
ncbi:hypothetical protein, partial [Nonomuraea cypriaca]|uniref:hypothetical protein n=1 Tax=Nonomuraea cypriaca TaxID=1187855 RepID=UPI001A9C4ED8